MKADFLPGFAVAVEPKDTVSNAALISIQNESKGRRAAPTPSGKFSPVRSVTGNSALYVHRWDALAFRVKHFTCSLSPARRAEIARQPRFRNQPYLRRSDEPDLDDMLL